MLIGNSLAVADRFPAAAARIDRHHQFGFLHPVAKLHTGVIVHALLRPVLAIDLELIVFHPVAVHPFIKDMACTAVYDQWWKYRQAVAATDSWEILNGAV